MTLPSNEVLDVQIAATDKVMDLKRRISEEEELKIKSFDVVYEGLLLDEKKELTDLGIENMSRIEVVLSKHGDAHRRLKTLLGTEPKNTHFKKYLLQSDFTAIQSFINYGMSVNSLLTFRDNMKRRPIHMLVARGDFKILKQFLALPDLNLNLPDSKGNTAFSNACAACSFCIEIVELLANQEGIELNTKSNHGNTPLARLCHNVNVPILLFKKIVNFPTIDVNSDSTARPIAELLRRHSEDDNERIDIMLSRGYLVCIADVSDACQYSNLDMVKKLLPLIQSDNSTTLDQFLQPACCNPTHGLVILRYLISNLEDGLGDTSMLLPAVCVFFFFFFFFFFEEKTVNGKRGGKKKKQACRYCCRDIIEYLLDNSAGINILNKNGESPIMMAASSGDIDFVKWFLSKGDCDVVNGNPTALAVAASNNFTEMFSLLLRRQSDINEPHVDGGTALRYAIECQLVSDIDYILSRDDLDPNTDSVPPLIAAVLADDETSVKKLLQHKNININESAVESNINAFTVAVHKGYLPLVKMLLEIDDLDLNQGANGIEVAVTEGHDHVLSFLLSDDRFLNKKVLQNVFANAVEKNFIKCVEVLMPLVDKNLIDLHKHRLKRGMIPLHLAAALGHSEVVSLLSNHPKARVNIVDSMAPLHISVVQGHLEVSKILCQNSKVKLNLADNAGWTPFALGCQNGRIGIIKYLTSLEAVDVNLISPDCCPLSAACEANKTDVVKYLCSVDRIDINHPTVLHHACARDDVKHLKIFYESGRSNFQSLDEKGDSPICVAAFASGKSLEYLLSFTDIRNDINKQFTDVKYAALHCATASESVSNVKQVLSVSGVNVNQMDVHGTPLIIAIRSHNILIVETLLSAGSDPNLQLPDGSTSLMITTEYETDEDTEDWETESDEEEESA